MHRRRPSRCRQGYVLRSSSTRSRNTDSGCRTLRPFGSSRSEDSFIQVGVHGTGASLPPVDEQVISMKLVTPAKGTIELSREKDPDLFYCCGLGGLGVIAEVTLQSVERQRPQLVEHTFISNADEEVTLRKQTY